MFWLYVLVGIVLLLVILWRFDRRGTGRGGRGMDRRQRVAQYQHESDEFFKGGGL